MSGEIHTMSQMLHLGAFFPSSWAEGNKHCLNVKKQKQKKTGSFFSRNGKVLVQVVIFLRQLRSYFTFSCEQENKEMYMSNHKTKHKGLIPMHSCVFARKDFLCEHVQARTLQSTFNQPTLSVDIVWTYLGFVIC